MSKNAPDFGAYARFVQVSAPFFVHFAGLSGRGLYGIMIWTWMLWPPYALGKRTEL